MVLPILILIAFYALNPIAAVHPGMMREVTIAGHTFRASNRTIWHLKWTIWYLSVRYPRARLRILQTCYHTGVALSAGTHDFDCCLDVWIDHGVLGADPWRAQRVLRMLGWAAWFRHTGPWADPSNWHIHMVSLPVNLPAHPSALDVGRAYEALGIKVGEFIDGGYTTKGYVDATSQIVDYYNHAEGLKGEHNQNADPSWHPADINKTVFRRAKWFNRTAA